MSYVIQTFVDLPVRTQFRSNGNDWLKVSTRTARLNGNGMVMYFRLSQPVNVDTGHFEDITRGQE